MVEINQFFQLFVLKNDKMGWSYNYYKTIDTFLQSHRVNYLAFLKILKNPDVNRKKSIECIM